MRRTVVLAVAALALTGVAVSALLPERPPPSRVWALETTDGDGLPIPVRIAARPGGPDLFDFDLTHCSGGGGMGGNVVHFLTLRRRTFAWLRDLVREPPLATLGYRREPHVISAEGGEWRELVRRNDDGTVPPVPDGATLTGTWEHVAGDRRACPLVLRADGTVELPDGDGQGSWTRSGATLVLAVTFAPGGVWPTGPERVRDHAVCALARDGAAYAGNDARGRSVRGRRIAPR